eukprot:scaffold12995_cov61-Cyclotella_meneghiniana.AAC.2
MTSQNGLTTATTISLNFVNIQLQHKPQEVNRPHFTTATIDCKSQHYGDGQCILKGPPLLNPNNSQTIPSRNWARGEVASTIT